MNVTIEQTALRCILKRASRAVRKVSPLPELQCLHLQTCGSGLNVRATDYEIEIGSGTYCEVTVPGEVVVPARPLLELVAALAPGPVCLHRNGASLVIETKECLHQLAVVECPEFPRLPVISTTAPFIEMGSTLLREAFLQVTYAVPKDSCRIAETGAQLRVNGAAASLAAANGRRHVQFELDLGAETGAHYERLIPRSTLAELLEFLPPRFVESDIVIESDAEQIRFSDDNGSYLQSRLIAAQFPDYSRVTDTVPTRTLRMERAALLQALRRLQKVSDAGLCRSRWAMVGQSLVLDAADNSSRGQEKLAGQVGRSGPFPPLWLNAQEVSECLRMLKSKEIVFGFRSPIEPVQFFGSEESVTVTLMPMSLPAEEN